MKPGKLGAFYVLALVFSATLFIQSQKLTEIPKLEKRVDELTKTIEAQETELSNQQEVIKVTSEAYEGESQQRTVLEGKVKALTNEVTRKTKELNDKNQEIKNLKKTKPVGNNFEVTWYNDYGHTASGRFVKKGVTIAVDKRVIPLGTWVKLEFPNGETLIRRADDTGGAVKGHIIDIYDNASTGTLLKRGRTHGVKVSILTSRK